MEPKTARPVTGLDRVADIVFVLFLLTQTLQAQSVWSIAYSPTRAVFFAYGLAAMALLGRFWVKVPVRVTVAVAILTALVVAGQISWTWEWDSHQANNYWQDWRLMLAALVFAAAFGVQRWALWSRVIICFALFLAILQVVVLLGGPVAGIGDGGGPVAFYQYRPVSAQMALLMIAALVFLLIERAPAGWHLGAAAFLGVSVVVSQHRSAWVALAVTVLVLGIQGTRAGWGLVRLSPLLFTVAFWVLALLLPTLVGRSLLPGSVAADVVQGPDLPTTVTSTGNFDWRVEMWRSRLHAPRSLLEVLTGGAFGSTAALGPDAVTMNPYTSAHNLLLDQFIMIGLVGIGCLAVIVGSALVVRSHPSTGIPVVLTGALAFGVFYNWPVWLWLLVGTACALIRAAPDPPVGARVDHVEMAA